MSIIIWLTWSKLASYQYGVFRAQKSHNAYSTVPVFKSCKIKSHTLEERHTLRPPRSPLDARLRWDGADPACLINSSLRKPSVRRITHTHTHTHTHTLWLSCSSQPACTSSSSPLLSAPLSLSLSLSLFLPLRLCSLSPRRLMWECVSPGLLKLWSHLRTLSRARDSTQRYALLGEGLAGPGFPLSPAPSQPGLGWWLLPPLPPV